MTDNQKSIVIGTMAAIIVFSIFFYAVSASQKTVRDSKIPMVEKYYQNFSVSPAQKLIIASQPFKITEGMWVYLTYNGPVGTDLNDLKFFTPVYAPTKNLSVGDTVNAVKFHGSDNYGYFYVSKK